MPTRRFTLADLVTLVVLSVLLLCMVHSLPGCGLSAARNSARQMQNSTHVRGIHSGMVMFAQGNRDQYPGITPDGVEATGPLPDGPNDITTTATGGFDPAYRVAILLRMGVIPGEYFVSPGEKKGVKTIPGQGTSITSANFSYAMLRISDKTAKGRTAEWQATNNSRAPIITDRNLGAGTGKSSASIWNSPWQGSIVYNDNHAVFEKSSTLTTAYGMQHETLADDLFADDNNKTGTPGNDAAMVHHDAVTYVNQK